MPTKYVNVDGTAVNYLHTGRSTLPDVVPPFGAGEVVLFVHGAGWNAQLWRAQLEALAAEHSPLAFDFPAHGRSGGTESMDDVAAFAACLGSVVRVLRLRPCVIVGHDLGAAAALLFAVTEPVRVRGLVLVGAGVRMPVSADTLDTWRQVAQGRRPQPFTPDIFAAGTDMAIMRSVWGEQVRTDPRVRYGDLRALDAFDAESLAAQARLPTLVVAGGADAVTPPAVARALQERIPGATLTVIEGAGHMMANERPREFTDSLLRFLDRMTGQRQ